MSKRYVVVREYSSVTARNVLWKVLSRPIEGRREAETWREFMEEQERIEHPRMSKRVRFMIVEVDHE